MLRKQPPAQFPRQAPAKICSSGASAFLSASSRFLPCGEQPTSAPAAVSVAAPLMKFLREKPRCFVVSVIRFSSRPCDYPAKHQIWWRFAAVSCLCLQRCGEGWSQFLSRQRCEKDFFFPSFFADFTLQTKRSNCDKPEISFRLRNYYWHINKLYSYLLYFYYTEKYPPRLIAGSILLSLLHR